MENPQSRIQGFENLPQETQDVLAEMGVVSPTQKEWPDPIPDLPPLTFDYDSLYDNEIIPPWANEEYERQLRGIFD
jgi:hypothetical protein